jgi:hypothetical protein
MPPITADDSGCYIARGKCPATLTTALINGDEQGQTKITKIPDLTRSDNRMPASIGIKSRRLAVI